VRPSLELAAAGAPGAPRLTTTGPLPEASDLFDSHALNYRRTVDTAVRFSGKDLAFFTAAKAHHIKRIARQLSVPLEQASVLDVGCGAGGLDRLLAPHFGRLVGVDVSTGMLEEARRRNPEIEYLGYSGQQLPFEDRTFDVVFAVCVVHHVNQSQWASFVAEMWRVARPGGVVVIVEHNPLNPLTRRSVASCEFDVDAVLTRPGPLVGMLRDLGAEPVRSRYFLFTPFGGERVQSIEGRLLARLPLGAQYIVAAVRRPEGSIPTTMRSLANPSREPTP
jgi:SAM-dependent methyltransferase